MKLTMPTFFYFWCILETLTIRYSFFSLLYLLLVKEPKSFLQTPHHHHSIGDFFQVTYRDFLISLIHLIDRMSFHGKLLILPLVASQLAWWLAVIFGTFFLLFWLSLNEICRPHSKMFSIASYLIVWQSYQFFELVLECRRFQSCDLKSFEEISIDLDIVLRTSHSFWYFSFFFCLSVFYLVFADK